MKNFKSIALAAVSLALAAQSPVSPAFAAENEINIGVSDVFIPGGFDSNSDVNVIASGLFPNSCYRWSKADVQKKAGNLVEIRPKATVRSGMCLMVLVPFTTEIGLGKLNRGDNTLRFISGDGTYLEKHLVLE